VDEETKHRESQRRDKKNNTFRGEKGKKGMKLECTMKQYKIQKKKTFMIKAFDLETGFGEKTI
jgi:hypothetical protein